MKFGITMWRSAGLAAALSVSLWSGTASAQWGSVKGQVVLDGEIPKLKVITEQGKAARDPEVCAKDGDIPSEALVVSAKTKGIANIFVYVKKAAKVHPDLAKSKEAQVTFDQKGCRFLPHALVVRTDQEVKVLSDDGVAHNTHTFPIRGEAFNSAIKANDRTGVPVKAKVAESLPFEVKCDYHPWMKAYWLVLDHPYATVTDEDGNFEIKNLPAGKHEFVLWQESAGYVNRKLEVTITDGKATEIPVIKVPVSKFKL